MKRPPARAAPMVQWLDFRADVRREAKLSTAVRVGLAVGDVARRADDRAGGKAAVQYRSGPCTRARAEKRLLGNCTTAGGKAQHANEGQPSKTI